MLFNSAIAAVIAAAMMAWPHMGAAATVRDVRDYYEQKNKTVRTEILGRALEKTVDRMRSYFRSPVDTKGNYKTPQAVRLDLKRAELLEKIVKLYNSAELIGAVVDAYDKDPNKDLRKRLKVVLSAKS